MSTDDQELRATKALMTWRRTRRVRDFNAFYRVASRWMHAAAASGLAKGGFLNRDTAMDVVSACWVSLVAQDYRALVRFEPQLVGGRGLRAFLSKIARRGAFAFLKGAKKHPSQVGRVDPDDLAVSGGHDQVEARQLWGRVLSEVLEDPSDNELEIILSLFLFGRTALEESARTGLSPASFYGRKRRIKDKAKKWIAPRHSGSEPPPPTGETALNGAQSAQSLSDDDRSPGDDNDEPTQPTQ